MIRKQPTCHSRTLRAAIAVAAWSLVVPAQALELGEANLRSALGERLLVEIPITSDLPLPSGCVDARVGNVGGLMKPAAQRQRPAGLVLSTPRIVTEPMLSVSVTVACPGVPRLVRDYTLFLDPAAITGERKASVLAEPRAAAAPRRRPAPVAVREPETTLRRYRVQTGDTVSAIAATLTAPGQDYWPMVDRIVAANPAAFIDDDPDRLLAGSLLSLPAAAVMPAAAGAGASAAPRPDEPVIDAPQAVVSVPVAAVPERTAAAADFEPAAPAATDAAPATRTTADRLLNVLNNTDATAGPASTDSPFVDAAPAATAAGQPKAPEAASPATAGASWTGRLIGLAAGMFIALTGFAAWQRMSAPSRNRKERRPIEAPRAPMPESLRAELLPTDVKDTPQARASDPMSARPPRPADLVEPRNEAVPRDSGTFTFHTPESAEPSAATPAPQPRDSSITVGALDSIDFEALQRDLDDATQEMLAADYEAEFSRTQLLEQQAAAQALEDRAAPEHDVTIEMQGYDTRSDTVRMPADYDAGFGEATEARYVDENTASVETEAMPGFDLDLDVASTSMVLRSSGEALSEALGEDLDIEADETPRKKQA